MKRYDTSIACEGKVFSVNVSRNKGNMKVSVDKAILTETGIEGNAHNCINDVQVSILKYESMQSFCNEYKKEYKPGNFGENLAIQGLKHSQVNLLDHFIINDAKMEVARIGIKCTGEECIIFQTNGECLMQKEGIFLNVVKPGVIKLQDKIEHIPRIFNFKVITLSNNAFEDKYNDTGRYDLQSILKDHFDKLGRKIHIEHKIIFNDAEILKNEIEESVIMGNDVIFTIGGTGVGLRDVTYDVVSKLCDKTIPGLTEYIRVKYGEENPHALLSRSIVGIIKNVLIYTLPGSKRAVKEYMDVLLETMEHLIYVLNGLGS